MPERRKTSEPTLAEEIAAASEALEYKAIAERAVKQAARARSRQVEYVEAVYSAARDSAVLVGRPPKIPAPTRDRRRGGHDEVALWHLTDWQGGKETVSYNLAKMDARVSQFCSKAVGITNIQRADHPVRECVILFGGDMIENVTTFPGQVWEVEVSLFDQIFHVAALCESVVRYALEHYEKVTVVAEPGNHGRIGRKGDGVKASDNYDRMVYKIAADRLADEKRLTWHQDNERWFQPVEVGNYRAMLIHGDEVRGFGGNTPAYALVRKGNAWASGAVDFTFRDIYVGHFHNTNQYSLAAGGMIYMTGSTESDNEYAREFVAAASTPTQRLHFINPRKGRVTAQYVIHLDDPEEPSS